MTESIAVRATISCSYILVTRHEAVGDVHPCNQPIYYKPTHPQPWFTNLDQFSLRQQRIDAKKGSNLSHVVVRAQMRKLTGQEPDT